MPPSGFDRRNLGLVDAPGVDPMHVIRAFARRCPRTAGESIGLSFALRPSAAEEVADCVRTGEPIVVWWDIEDAQKIWKMLGQVIADLENTRQ